MAWIIFDAGLIAVLFLAALFLYWRDRTGAAQGKSPAQIQAGFKAVLELRAVLYRSALGILAILFGMFSAVDRERQHESGWWMYLLFIPAGWVLIPLLARKSWKRYRQLKRFAEQTHHIGL